MRGLVKSENKILLSEEKDILISAPLEKVWSEFTNIDQWSEWRRGVTHSKLDGALAVGAKFYWNETGLGITSTIQRWEPMQTIGWVGKARGMEAVLVWTFERRNDETYVKVEESVSGWLARLFKFFDPHFVEKSSWRALQSLKAHVEGK